MNEIKLLKQCPLLNISLIPLTRGKYAIVDAGNYKRLSKYKWYTCKSKYTSYAVRSCWDGKKIIFVYMHREILNTPAGLDTDHINGNGLDNRIHNLRACSRGQHHCNRHSRPNSSSKYKGVHWDRYWKKWAASIRIRKKLITLGRFDNEEEAAKVYNEQAKLNFGDFARLNNV